MILWVSIQNCFILMLLTVSMLKIPSHFAYRVVAGLTNKTKNPETEMTDDSKRSLKQLHLH